MENAAAGRYTSFFSHILVNRFCEVRFCYFDPRETQVVCKMADDSDTHDRLVDGDVYNAMTILMIRMMNAVRC